MPCRKEEINLRNLTTRARNLGYFRVELGHLKLDIHWSQTKASRKPYDQQDTAPQRNECLLSTQRKALLKEWYSSRGP